MDSNTTELSTALADQIRERHEAAQRFAADAKGNAQKALQAAVECGRFLSDAQKMSKGAFLGWLRDHVPRLTPDQAKAYLSLLHGEEKRESHRIEAGQLKLLGIIGDAERKDPQPRQANSHQWAGYLTRAWTAVAEVLEASPVETWADDQRAAMRATLKPWHDLYEKL